VNDVIEDILYLKQQERSLASAAKQAASSAASRAFYASDEECLIQAMKRRAVQKTLFAMNTMAHEGNH
jgi:hypothetical protein